MNGKLNAQERDWVHLVKEQSCSVCGASGPSDAHHIKQGLHYTCVALCKSCHQGPLMGWHGQKRSWAIHKMDEMDALNVTISQIFSKNKGLS